MELQYTFFVFSFLTNNETTLLEICNFILEKVQIIQSLDISHLIQQDGRGKPVCCATHCYMQKSKYVAQRAPLYFCFSLS